MQPLEKLTPRLQTFNYSAHTAKQRSIICKKDGISVRVACKDQKGVMASNALLLHASRRYTRQCRKKTIHVTIALLLAPRFFEPA
jgi:hypothetical protein